MIPPVPVLQDYGISPSRGFLPPVGPLGKLPDPYYEPWETIVNNLQPLLLTKRLRGLVLRLPILSTDRLRDERELQRAYSVLGFIAHGYIWGGDKPLDRLPLNVSLPFLAVSEALEVPPVATYAGVVLWNFKPLFHDEQIDLENLSTLNTFTGSLDESWFYLVSVAIEARAAPILPTMLDAIQAARLDNGRMVTACLKSFAERMDDLGTLLQRMYETCDPHVFYHRIRPFLAGSKNMADAGLPNGVLYEDGTGKEEYRQYAGGSNAQSSLVQFFDLVLGVEHRPTGEKKPPETSESEEGTSPPARHNFIHDMRKYMPGPHRRFLEHVSNVANIREYVESHRSNRGLCLAYDACLAMLRTFRDKHIQMVSRYIIIPSRASLRSQKSQPLSPRAAPQQMAGGKSGGSPSSMSNNNNKKKLRGTGGTALIPFLKQARDETGEPAIDAWARRLLSGGGITGSNYRSCNNKTDDDDDIFSSSFGSSVRSVALSPAAATKEKIDERRNGNRSGAFSPVAALAKENERRNSNSTTTTTNNKNNNPNCTTTDADTDKMAEVDIVGLAGTWTMSDSEGGLCHW